jgi:Adenine-specific DNA methylase containing a Zn-ribbon
MSNSVPQTHAESDGAKQMPRAIEMGFPIVEINRLAEPERNSFKPIYQMHKWFARRASCVFRAILLGALKPAYQEDGTPVDLMEEFYKDHSRDSDTQGKMVLDPFMGGGTTVVEALRLGCKVIGIDLNPIAWFIVKTEVEPVKIEALKAAFERLAARPVAWNDNKPLRDTLLDLYKTELAPALEADVIYTFWVKHAVCTDPTCKREVPLFKDYRVAAKTLSVKYHRDMLCPECRTPFDWEVNVASLIADSAMMVNSPRGAAGEGRPTAAWAYAPEPPRPKSKRETSFARLTCPHCRKHIRVQIPWDKKKERKKVPLTVLLCPACEAVWQWRGPLPEGEVTCPACHHRYDPRKGNVPEKGYFQCRCGNKDRIIESIRLLPQERRLPVRPYATQAYLPAVDEEQEDIPGTCVQGSLFGDGADRQQTLPLQRSRGTAQRLSAGFVLPGNGKFFKRWSTSDQARLQRAEMLWERHKASLPYPKSTIPVGFNTNQMIKHHYRYWHEMFAPRQLLALSTLLAGIMTERDEKLREMLLCAFSNALEANNLFTRHRVSRSSVGSLTAEGVFARHDFQPKVTVAENNVFGLPNIAAGSFLSEYGLVVSGMDYHAKGWDFRSGGSGETRAKVEIDSLSQAERTLICGNSAEITFLGFRLS